MMLLDRENEFKQAFMDALLFAVQHDEDWLPDRPPTVDGLGALTLAKALNSCTTFERAAASYFKGRDAEAGHDFWMTRNGEGVGFWDGDWPDPAATIFTVAAHAVGPFELYRGDDGKVHTL
ncbi:hypothetical protein AB0H73_06330 [Streptomyces olivoreticuli]